MAVSRFGQSRKDHQLRLLEELVVTLLGKEAPISARRRAVGICQHRLRFHSYQDTNPSSVSTDFTNVCEILKTESHEREFQRLQILKEKFFAMEWNCDVIEIHSSVLRFLLGLTGNLTSREGVSMEVDISSPSPQSPDVEASGSEVALSEWSEESEVASVESPTESSSPEGVVSTPLPWLAFFQEPPLATSVQIQPKENEKTLLSELVKLQAPELGVGVCPMVKKSEVELVMESLRVLQGESSGIFAWDPIHRSFLLESHLQVDHFSSRGLRSVLSWFGEVGCLTRDLLDWTRSVINCSGRQELTGEGKRRSPVVCPTLSAAAQSVHSQLTQLLSSLTQTEERLEAQTEGPQRSLIWMKERFGWLVRKIEFLHGVYVHLQSIQRKQDRPESVLNCEILDLLFDLCLEEFMMNSNNHSEYWMMWNIFCESLKPFLTQLSAWLYLGDLPSISNDFLISTEGPRNTEESNFWTDAFPLKEQSCPRFMESIVKHLVDGGKALQILRNQEYRNQFGEFGMCTSIKIQRLETLIDELWTKNLLYEKFTAHLSAHFTASLPSPTQTYPQPVEDSNFFLLMAKKEIFHSFADEGDNKKKTVEWRLAEGAKVELVEDELEMEEQSELPEDYTRVLQSMERVQEALETSLESITTKNSILSKILPHPTNRDPFPFLDGAMQSSREIEGKMDCCVPPTELLKEALLDPLQERSSQIMRSFISCLLNELGLLNEMLILKNVFLMGSPAIAEWVHRFTETLNHGFFLKDLTEYQVIMEMQECFLTCGVGEKLPVCGDKEFEDLFFDMRTVDWDKRYPDQEIWKERSPQELEDCALLYPLEWPLCLLVNDHRLRKYNKVFLFLLKLQWSTYAMNETKMLMKKVECGLRDDFLGHFSQLKNWRNVYKVVHEMTHFLRSLRQHIFEKVHHSFERFQERIVGLESVSEMLRQHDEMLETIQRLSFQSKKKQWKTVHTRLLTLFHSILNFSSLWQTIHSTNPQDLKMIYEVLKWMDVVLEEYNEARTSVMMILHIYSYSLGGNVELNDLITILNFNHTYVHYDPKTI